MPSPLKELRRQLKVLPPSVAELSMSNVSLTGIWTIGQFLDHQIISSNHVKWNNSEIDSALS